MFFVVIFFFFFLLSHVFGPSAVCSLQAGTIVAALDEMVRRKADPSLIRVVRP